VATYYKKFVFYLLGKIKTMIYKKKVELKRPVGGRESRVQTNGSHWERASESYFNHQESKNVFQIRASVVQLTN
jgi:hypothetical protein